MTRCESYPLCSGTIYFPTAPFLPLQEPNLCKDKFRYLNSMEENL